jgi:transposase
VEWRRARDAGGSDAGGQATDRWPVPEQAENDRLRGENERLHGELAKTQAALDLVGKAHALLELLSESADTEKRSKR